jgi:MerR family redox-sensitive transcriptional activator SoxR
MLSIGEVATLTGLRPSALRYYEQAGLVSPVARVSGRRHYDESVLGRLGLIACAQDAGFTIAEIRELLAGERDHRGRWRALAERKLREVEAVMAKVEATRRLLEESLDCDCLAVEECATLVAGRRERGQEPVAGADPPMARAGAPARRAVHPRAAAAVRPFGPEPHPRRDGRVLPGPES